MHEHPDENFNYVSELLNLMQASPGGRQQSFLTKSALRMATKFLTISNSLWIRLEFWLQNSNIPEMAEHVMVYLTEHPPVALLVGIFLLACGFPLLVFLIFAVVSAILTLIGFVIVEGTILAVATFILISVLIGMVGTAALVAAVCAVAYYSAAKLADHISSVMETTSISQPTKPEPPATAPRVSRLRRGSAFFGAPSHSHQHDIFSLSHRSHLR